MKSTSSYFILLVSFFGLLFLQQYENRNNQRDFPEQNQKTKIDQTIIEDRLGALEVSVDSLLEPVNNQSTIELGEAKPFVEPLKELHQSESVECVTSCAAYLLAHFAVVRTQMHLMCFVFPNRQ